MSVKQRVGLAVAGLLAMGATWGTWGTAGAAPPIVVKPSSALISFDIPAGEACAYPVNLEVISGKGGAKFFADGRAFLSSPGMVIRLTNLDTGASMTVTATGSIHDAPTVAVGDELRWDSKFTGHNVLFGLADQEGSLVPVLKYYVGRVTLTNVIDVNGVFSAVDIDESAARVVDVCASLG